MTKSFTLQDKKKICEEFAVSKETARCFCKGKNISLSSLYRWKNFYKNNSSVDSSAMKQINISPEKNHSSTYNSNPMQIVLKME